LKNDGLALAELIANAPFRKFASVFLRIENELGELVPFELNEAQLIIDNEIERQIAAGRPQRVRCAPPRSVPPRDGLVMVAIPSSSVWLETAPGMWETILPRASRK